MIFLKGLTTVGAYDQEGKYLEDIQSEIKDLVKQLHMFYDIYQFYTSHQVANDSDFTSLIYKGKLQKTFVHFYKVNLIHFEEGSSFAEYLLVNKDEDLCELIEKTNIKTLPHVDNLNKELLKIFPLIIRLSDSSEVIAYSECISKLDFIDELTFDSGN
ncbi:hypothetical protein ACYRFS_05865 [Listeria kieliensis]|uniref:Uncharacterized protein n=1 Tax=Listeria kieliensis TaxID=1621700 RepID=A0A3D8TPZ3_9LIST|nr:hypothetical protein [Listeria kieliensis]RDX00721.1 hypothetical protein UR08_06985 [Listeria kieliensis]